MKETSTILCPHNFAEAGVYFSFKIGPQGIHIDSTSCWQTWSVIVSCLKMNNLLLISVVFIVGSKSMLHVVGSCSRHTSNTRLC